MRGGREPCSYLHDCPSAYGLDLPADGREIVSQFNFGAAPSWEESRSPIFSAVASFHFCSAIFCGKRVRAEKAKKLERPQMLIDTLFPAASTFTSCAAPKIALNTWAWRNNYSLVTEENDVASSRAAARSAPDPNLKQVGVSVLGVRPVRYGWL